MLSCDAPNLCITMSNTVIPFFFLTAFLLSIGCTSDVRQEEYAGLLQQAASLEQRHCRLKSSTDSLWDVTSARLEKAMPPGFPAVDRDIFLKARNADHMRMFMSFQKLDAAAQSLVNEAGKYDAILAAQVQNLLKQQQDFEKRKISFLKKMEQKDAASVQTYAAELRTAGNGMCR